MREILFRGKRIDNGKWVEGSLWVNIDEIYILSAANCVGIEVDPETVGQYTGMICNCKKIFEGDILESPIGRKAIVSFGTYKPFSTKDSDDFECWKLILMVNNTGETKLECGLGKHCTEYMRLIGNIYDDPELVGGADNG
jgi:hypothetical protein